MEGVRSEEERWKMEEEDVGRRRKEREREERKEGGGRRAMGPIARIGQVCNYYVRPSINHHPNIDCLPMSE